MTEIIVPKREKLSNHEKVNRWQKRAPAASDGGPKWVGAYTQPRSLQASATRPTATM